MARKRTSGFRSFKNRTKMKKKAVKNSDDRKSRNYKFLKRSKEAEDAQRKQKLIEDKYKRQINAEESMSEDEEENLFDKLVSSFQKKTNEKQHLKAIESSSDEDDFTELEEYENDSISDEENQKGDADSECNEQTGISRGKCHSDIEFEGCNGDSLEKENGSSDEEFEEIPEEQLDKEITKVRSSGNGECLDPFSIHLEKELSHEHVENLLAKPARVKTFREIWPELGNLYIEISIGMKECREKDPQKNKNHVLLFEEEDFASEGKPPKLIDSGQIDLNSLYLKSQLIPNILEANLPVLESLEQSCPLTPLQKEVFAIINNYQDLFYPHRSFKNEYQLRVIYCLHILNHMLKTRTKILHHNAKLSAETNKKERTIVPDSCRDQGLVRPKILIVLPFKNSALCVVNTLASLLFGSNDRAKNVLNYSRFIDEYTGDSIKFPKRNPKPEDYERIFAGNTEDNFRIGIALTKKSMKLYTEFYSSDILIASPLGLRMIVGAPGDSERDYDFLTSVEILVLDQAELFFAQNWDHLLHVLDHLHLQPQSVRNTDFSRVRPWCLNGLTRFYRQSLLFTSHDLPEFRSLFNNKCFNYRGKIRITNPIIRGTIRSVIMQIPQVFHKIEVTSVESSFDIRFKYFINEILPQYKSLSMAHCMIYVPSYFDYVRIRNYLKSESINFVQICEYTKDAKIARARDMFFHSSAHFLLYSERAHFFRRTRIKGIRHLLMYQPTSWPHLYSEMINLMQDANQNPRDGLESSMSVAILYTKYDLLQLSAIIGTERASKICQSNKSLHMFMTSDN